MHLIKKNLGITLIEILLMLMILAIFIAIFARFYLNHTGHPIIHTGHPILTKTEQTILIIKNGMKFYKLDNGDYPTTEQGIAALVKKPTTKPIPQHWIPYLKTMPLDSKGRPYHYANPGKHDNIDVWAP